MSSSGPSDPDIARAIERLQRGVEVEASGKDLFLHYYPWIVGFFRRRGHSLEDAEELSQDTLFAVLHGITSFRGESTFDAWVFALAANRHRNALRWSHQQRRSGPEVPLDASRAGEDRSPIEPAADLPSPARLAHGRRRHRAVAQAVEGLPRQMRHCLILRVDRELKYRQIAVLLGISINTVKAHLFQARERLRTELGDEIEDWLD